MENQMLVQGAARWALPTQTLAKRAYLLWQDTAKITDYRFSTL